MTPVAAKLIVDRRAAAFAALIVVLALLTALAVRPAPIQAGVVLVSASPSAGWASAGAGSAVPGESTPPTEVSGAPGVSGGPGGESGAPGGTIPPIDVSGAPGGSIRPGGESQPPGGGSQLPGGAESGAAELGDASIGASSADVGFIATTLALGMALVTLLSLVSVVSSRLRRD
ncbi:MAG TPA: hypothetical protein VJA85_09120 [Candidatus Limnocylindria bacterium]|nr:hypothetical protein [Candidatus Limnocylindria bacterium]